MCFFSKTFIFLKKFNYIEEMKVFTFFLTKHFYLQKIVLSHLVQSFLVQFNKFLKFLIFEKDFNFFLKTIFNTNLDKKNTVFTTYSVW